VEAVMVKKVIAAAIAGIGAVLVALKIKEQRAEQELWSEATDDIRP
jgi:hypothetical protein